ncbi:BnaC02g11910D [Brassica napus]|uniref:BnaC02g11910D protein n=1 Tax=Brassica napus TaxID=3708 RepID=A0A078H636_BRANA|nr:BnaC02g11910D [Brassica napus]
MLSDGLADEQLAADTRYKILG